jgi:hypothetical protein
MKKAKQRATELDQIVTQLRTILHRQTTDVVLAGDLLIESRQLFANEHGEWQPWLAENFDLSLRTAQNYVTAAEYVARQKQIGNGVADFTNLAPTVLYALAAGRYSAEEEAAILAATHIARVDQTRASDICDALAPVELTLDITDEIIAAAKAVAAAEDAEIAAIIDGGADPAVLPTPNLPPTNFALRDFDQAISTLKRLMTKSSAQFAATVYTIADLEHIKTFIDIVTKAKTAAQGIGARTNDSKVTHD